MTDAEVQRTLDVEHLRLLRLGYLITGIVNAVFAFFPLLYVAFGIFIANSDLPRQGMRPGQPEPAWVGWFMAIFGAFFCAFLVIMAILKLLAAKSIRERRHLTLCKIAAGVTCLGIPYGTVLGVLTFQVLARPSVAALFGYAETGYPNLPLPPA